MRADVVALAPWFRALRSLAPQLGIGALLLFLTVLSGIGLLTLSGWFITATGLTALAWHMGQSAVLDIYVPGAGIRTFALTRTVARYAERVVHHDAVLRLLASLRLRTFRTISQLPVDRLKRVRAGKWLERLTTDIDALDTLYLRLIAPPLVALMAVLLVSGFISWHLPRTGLIVGAGLVSLLTWLTLGTALQGRQTGLTLADSRESLRLTLQDRLQALGERVAGGYWPDDVTAIQHHIDQMDDRENRLEKIIARQQAIATLTLQTAAVLVMLIGLDATANDRLHGAIAVMLPFSLLALNEVFSPLTRAFADYGRTLGAAQRLNALADDAPPAPAEAEGSGTLSGERLSLRQVGLTHTTRTGNPQPILGGLDLDVIRGQQVGVIGESGAGKSTLADIIAGLAVPDRGRREGIPQVTDHSGQTRVAYLTQATELFNESVRVNLLLGAPDATDPELWSALQKVRLDTLVGSLPEGLDTVIGDQGRLLSGGESRRLALARVLLSEPDWLILDEPYTGLDAGTRHRIDQNLAAWFQRRTLIVLGHDPAAMPPVNRVYRLSGGRLNALPQLPPEGPAAGLSSDFSPNR